MIFAIRHGETLWNKEGRVQGGGSDSPLTKLGIETAHELGKRLKEYNIDVIYSSDLGRAKQTTDIINSFLHKKIVYSELLRETNYGIAEGIKSSDLDNNIELNRISSQVDAGDNNAHFKGGESRNTVYNRFMVFLNLLPIDKNVLISTHGGILRTFTKISVDIDKKIPNCGGIQFEIDQDRRPCHINLFNLLEKEIK